MMKKPDTFRELIEAIGGVNVLAEALGVGEFAAKKMRDRSSVAVKHWSKLIHVARDHGYLLTTDDFVTMSFKRTVEKPRKARAAA